MKRTKPFQTLFSPTLIAALVLAATPMTAAHALSGPSAQTTNLATTDSHAVTLTSHVVGCRSIIIWYYHRRVTIRVRQRVHPHD